MSGEAELLMDTVRFALVGVCYISEEHAHSAESQTERKNLSSRF